jgi:hypothetical protein
VRIHARLQRNHMFRKVSPNHGPMLRQSGRGVFVLTPVTDEDVARILKLSTHTGAIRFQPCLELPFAHSLGPPSVSIYRRARGGPMSCVSFECR